VVESLETGSSGSFTEESGRFGSVSIKMVNRAEELANSVSHHVRGALKQSSRRKPLMSTHLLTNTEVFRKEVIERMNVWLVLSTL